MEGYEVWSSINIYANSQKQTFPIFLTCGGHFSLLTSWIEKYKDLVYPFIYFFLFFLIYFHFFNEF